MREAHIDLEAAIPITYTCTKHPNLGTVDARTVRLDYSSVYGVNLVQVATGEVLVCPNTSDVVRGGFQILSLAMLFGTKQEGDFVASDYLMQHIGCTVSDDAGVFIPLEEV